MINLHLEEDLALKRFVTTPKEQKPSFNWRGVVEAEPSDQSEIKIICPQGDESFDIKEVVNTIGKALTNVLLSRQEKDIFTEENKQWVEQISRKVGENLLTQADANMPVRVGLNDLYIIIEKTLVEHNAFDVAKSILLDRSKKMTTEYAQSAVAIRLIRRNGQVVPWNEAKIEIAVRKAFLSLELDSSPAAEVALRVTKRLMRIRQAFIHIEEVQDMVQEELMRGGHFKVAAHYIIYRERRATYRETEEDVEAEVPEQNSMVVVNLPDGESHFWDGTDLKKRIEFASIGLTLCLTVDEIEVELRRSIFDEITEDQLRDTIVLNAKTLMEKDADFAKFAGRIQLSYIYEEVLGWDLIKDGIGSLKSLHQKYLKKYLKHGVSIKRLNPKLLDFDLERLASALDSSADLEFDFLGIQTLYDRYLIVDKVSTPSRRIETPQIFWMRVAMGLFVGEEQDAESKIISLYELYKSRRFCSSTPTLFNSGTLHSQLSSCYLYWVDDSIEGIMQRGIAENAYLSKWAGGLGGSWTSVRGTGGYINGTNGESQGVIPFLKLHNDQLVAVNQGGKRRGSGCAYLETWHNDLYEFLELRRNTGDERRRCHDMNTANWIPDLFMKRMEAREPWTFFRSCEVPDLHETYGKEFETKYVEYERLAEEGKIFGKKVEAIEVWKRILKMLFETGHPWITFKDPCNIRSPQDHVGVIHSSNLCTEITLNTGKDETAVCNLGSVVLDSHLDDEGNIDHDKLKETIRIAVRALDNVIDINFYPTEAARRSNERHRPIGLGVMGVQNALYRRGVSFASQEAVEFNDEFMEAIAYYAYEASSDLAGEKGTYSTYKGSKWDRGLLPQDSLDLLEEARGVSLDVPRGGKMDWTPVREKIARQGMRNSNVLAIAPTATISNITGTSPCIEPAYKNLFMKSNLSGEFIVLNQFLVRDLKERDLWSQEMVDNLKYFDGALGDIEEIPDDLKKKYLTAFDIDYNWFIDSAARRQKWIDQSQSVNLFLGNPDLKVLSHMYRAAWRKGLKTTYYLRTLGASNIEKATVDVKKVVKGSMAGAQSGEKTYTDAEKVACSIEAMRNGEECEACQ
ncbi:MAG: ribonucleoside-diphosphate reductase subunit alpha [Opitutaceae bacterium]|nr:ribonucleoside-diphosphate reductase subunit alpha [Opitutaceae bacterium]